MTVQQSGATKNSVTIRISGITEGARETRLWVPFSVGGDTSWEWCTLDDAISFGFIDDYILTGDLANGTIEIVVSRSYLSESKVLFVRVRNVEILPETSETIEKASVILSTVTGFEYDNDAYKQAGQPIDITLSDMRTINRFGSDIDYLVGSGEGTYYPLDDVLDDADIFADYLRLPVENMFAAATENSWYLGENYSYIMTRANYLLNNVESGADFKAEYFNVVAEMINHFRLSFTV